MSKQKHYELITHEVTEKVLIGETMYCDVCKKEIEKGSGYWEVITNEDWFDDGADYVFSDICSDVCLTVKFAEYTDMCGKDSDNSGYMEIVKTRLE